MRDLGVSEGDISATTRHSIAVMRAVYSHSIPKERRGGRLLLRASNSRRSIPTSLLAARALVATENL
jgi:hypothetical protein